MTTRDERKRIFIVEDEPEMIKLHRDFLSDHFDVVIKSSGADAIQYLRKHPPIDLAIVDLRLPDVSGIDVLRELKKMLPRVPAIVITAFGGEDVAVKAFRCGARDYVKKPFTYGELMRRINFCLSLGAAEQGTSRSLLTSEAEELAETFVREAKAAKNFRVQQALKFIHANFSADISLDQVAEAAGLSKYHFSRLFKEATGVTYQSYLNRVRIDHARKLLDDDALSITDVGHSAGYADLTHFERIFKRLVGSTPTRYRRRQTGLR